jgi:hypothetical protein
MERREIIESFLEQLPEPYRQEALENFKLQSDFDKNGRSQINDAYQALTDAFDWRKTKQGDDYWRNFRGRLADEPYILKDRQWWW